jgi:hypothetical protein
LLSVANQFIRTPMFHRREARSCSILLRMNSCTSEGSQDAISGKAQSPWWTVQKSQTCFVPFQICDALTMAQN